MVSIEIISAITAECSGPVEKRGKERSPLMDPSSEGSIVKKWQKCGKKGCRCNFGGDLRHGPYHWLVTYNPDTKKQSWKLIKKKEK